MSIIEKFGITTGQLKVRTKTDDSGDYIRKSYDIMSCYPWGERGIVYEMENPNEARLFSEAPEMLEALIDRALYISDIGSLYMNRKDEYELSKIKSVIEKATGKTWEEIKALL